MLDRLSWILLSVVVVLMLAVFGYLIFSSDDPATITINPPPPTATLGPTGTPTPLEIYVTGAVAQPESRLSMPPGSRVEDAIAAAGGPTDDADLSGVNLAGILRDGDHIHVPNVSAPVVVPTAGAVGAMNINLATQADLETLPGIGPSTAQAIIEYRETNGPFESVDELDEVPGIGEATVENLRELVSVE